MRPVTRPRRSLFFKYFITLFVAVVVPLMLGAGTEAWFAFRDNRLYLNEILQVEARSAADRIQAFTDGIRDQLGWVVQFPWTQGEDERRRIDGLRLLQQVPAIVSLSLIDPSGTERVFVSRVSMNRTGHGADMSADPAVIGARANRVWYGMVHYRRDSEPYMRIAVAGNRAAAGVVVADINLKLIWDIIAGIKIGDTGHALVVDDSGRLIAHPDISLVLRSGAGAGDINRLKSVTSEANGSAVSTTGEDGKPVVALAVRAPNVGWTVIAEQPALEAYESIRAALWRSLILIVIGIVFALVLAYWRACRMWGPIRQLEKGVERIGMGQFDHRITIQSRDELEQLALRFNEMAEELGTSQLKSERINRLKQFLAPQVAELVEHSDQRLLDAQRREVVAIFGDLRGFTAFTARAEPEAILAVLRQYYEAVGAVTSRHEATLIRFAGDGVMVLVNAPVACENPAHRGIRLAIDMQAAVQSLAGTWSAGGCAIGFGVGVAMGPATVGTLGYQGRLDYTAIGNVVNLASRLCSLADDGQILLDPTVHERVKESFALASIGERPIKGYDRALEIFAVVSMVAGPAGEPRLERPRPGLALAETA
ncbi:HAMP domain-containing protein [Bradyrhizobium sp. WSM 1738]|uniref:adenylate/guanylate cyclase domain-containing protein n=1 Tax=Bradyrhizobium hereditatis TaxID=2821405 RepID=UPI001CE2C0EB|nr:adenylate/guanylate cyclase domain-containing protein [Bradyrhizobium hereditatis]MCA6116261.1 HAMP domain-containing protein [Bradyrhizobium hereditatis]